MFSQSSSHDLAQAIHHKPTTDINGLMIGNPEFNAIGKNYREMAEGLAGHPSRHQNGVTIRLIALSADSTSSGDTQEQPGDATLQ